MLALSYGYILDDTSPQAILVLFHKAPMPCEHGPAYGHYSIANAYQCACIHREGIRHVGEMPLMDRCRSCFHNLVWQEACFCEFCKTSYCLQCYHQYRCHTLMCQALGELDKAQSIYDLYIK